VIRGRWKADDVSYWHEEKFGRDQSIAVAVRGPDGTFFAWPGHAVEPRLGSL